MSGTYINYSTISTLFICDMTLLMSQLTEGTSGLYAIEENMHKNLIENNKLKEGPIFRFNRCR